MPDKPVIFISHISEEAPPVQLVKNQIENSFLDLVDVFVSSDSGSICAGQNWLDRITQTLRAARAMLIFCSQRSVSRPWINFEAGAGWGREIEIVPMYDSGMRPVDLPLPLNLLQELRPTMLEKLQMCSSSSPTSLGLGCLLST